MTRTPARHAGSQGLSGQLVRILLPPLALLLGLSVLLFLQVEHLLDLNESASRSSRAIARGNAIYRRLVDQESGVRGYFITGQDTFLDPYRKGKERREDDLRQLKDRVTDNPQQLARVEHLAAIYGTWEEDIADAVRRRAAGDTGPASLEEMTARRIHMDALRAQLETFLELEITLHRQHVAAAERQTRVILGVSAAVLLALAATIALATRRGLIRLSATYDGAIDAERETRSRAERTASRLSELQRLTAQLSAAHTVDEIARVLLSGGFDLLGAGAVSVFVVERDDVVLVRSQGYGSDAQDRWRRTPMTVRTPISDAVTARAPVWLDSRADLGAAYPELEAGALSGPFNAWASLPLLVHQAPVGALGVSFTSSGALTPDVRELAVAVAELFAQAFDRARLYEAERGARRAKEDILATVSHDLRNPLGVILMNAGMALKAAPPGPDGDPIRKRTRITQRAAEQMNRLIQDLLAASTIEVGRLVLDVRERDVGQLLADAVEELAPLAAQKAITLTSDAGDGPCLVACDGDRVAQVLGNLVGNAVKFTPEGGEISVRVRDAGDRVIVSVADTGRGIHEDQLPHIFDRYWSGRGKAGADTGLGLYIARGIVEAHGGTIEVATNPGVGTTFTFTLPRTPAAS